MADDTNSESESGPTPDDFRHVMRQVPTCVTIVAAMVDNEPQAMVIGSFVSVSLDPPMAGFFCTTTSSTWSELKKADVFGVNVLAHNQVDVSNAFMRPPEERFDDVDWTLDGGAPRIAGTSAFIRMSPHQIIEAGDHEFALCNVAELTSPGIQIEPILHYGGGYRTIAAPL